MSEEASPPTSQETQPESELQVQSEEAPSEALTMVTSEAEAPSEETIKPQIQEPQNSEAQESAPAAQVETIPQQVESSQVEDRVQADRQSESQSEEKMETSIVPPPIQNDGDSSDEDEGRPTRKIVIDEDDDGEPVVHKAPEPAQEAPKGLPYEDHNYGFGRPAARAIRQIADENNEPFPVIGGLASYLCEEENHSPPTQSVSRPITRIQQTVQAPHYTGHDYTTTRTIGPQGQTVHTIRMAAPRASSVGAPTLTSYRPVRETMIPMQTIQARRIMGPTTAPTLITRRPTLIRARRDGVTEQAMPGHVVVRTTPEGIRVRAPTQLQQGINVGSPMYHSTPIAASNVTNDPMRQANATAPAPFITTNRGTRIALRGRPSQPLVRTRLTREQTGQLIGPDGQPQPQPHIITTTTTMPTPTQQITYSPRKPGQQQPIYVSQLRRPPSASPTKLVSRGGLTYRQVVPSPAKGRTSDSALVNVVDEEELQNMQFLQQQEQKIQEKKPEAQQHVGVEGQAHEQVQEQQGDLKVAGRSPTSAAIELTRLRTSNVPITPAGGETPLQPGQQPTAETGPKLSEDGRTMVTMRPVMTRGRGRPPTRPFITGQEGQGIRLAQPYSQQGQRLPLSRTTNVNLDSLRLGYEYGRSPYVRFSSTPGTRIVPRNQVQQGVYGGQPVQVLRASPTHQIQVTQVPQDHEYAQTQPMPEQAQVPNQEVEGLPPQQVPVTTQATQIQVQPQPQHFRVIDYSQSRSPPRPLTPGTRVVHLQPYSPPRQRISSSGLEDLAQVSQQMQSQVMQSGQHAVYPIPITSPPRQYARTIDPRVYQYGQRPASPPKQFQAEPTYIQPQQMQHIPQPPPEQPQPPQDFLVSDHAEHQLPSMDTMQEQPQTVPEAFAEQLLYQQPGVSEEQKLPTDIGQEAKTDLPEPREEDDDLSDEWKDQDYTNRCLCGMTHNDEFMVECDRCNVWQHGVCMGITPKTVGKTYLCEQCNPRPLKHTQEEAAAIQHRYLERKRKWKERNKKLKQERQARKEQAKQARKSQDAEPIKKRAVSTGSAKTAKKFTNVAENEYTRRMKTFMNSTPNKGDINLPTTLPDTDVSARQMFVAPNVEGLVATRVVPQGQPVMEYTGKIGFQDEIHGREKLGSIQNFIVLYTGFGENEEMAVAVDARKIGSPARFARRSCHPNTQLKHVIRYGKLHLFLVATEDIDFSAEITIPFDYDWRQASSMLGCACGATDDKYGGEEQCPIREFNNTLPKEPKEEVNGVLSPRKSLATKKSEKTSLKPKSLVKTEGRGMPKAVSVSSSQKAKFKKDKVGKKSTRGKIKLRRITKRSESRSTKAEEPQKAKVDEKVEEEKVEPRATRSKIKDAVVKEDEPKQEKESRQKSPEIRRSQRTRTSSLSGPSAPTNEPAIKEATELKSEPEKEERRVTRNATTSESVRVPEKLMTPESEKPDRELQRALEQIRRIEESEKKKKEREDVKKKTTPKSDQKSKRGSSEKPSPKEKETKRTSPRKSVPEIKEKPKRVKKEAEEEPTAGFTSVADRLRRTPGSKSEKKSKVEEDQEEVGKSVETPRRSGRFTSTKSEKDEDAQKIAKSDADAAFSPTEITPQHKKNWVKESPSKRRKLDKDEDHQMTQVEAAQLLTEMAQSAIGIFTIYDDKSAPTVPQISPTAEKADILTQIRRLAKAEAPLRSADFELTEDFSTLDEPSTSAASFAKGSSRSLLQKALATSMRTSQRTVPKLTGKAAETAKPKTPPPTPRTPPLPEPEPPKKTKKLSLEEYKKRKIASQKNEGTPTTPDITKPTTPAETNTQERTTPNRKSFIPSMSDMKSMVIPENLINMVPPQITPQPTSIQDLKKKIYGGRRGQGAKSPPPELASTSSDEPQSKKSRLTPPPPAPNLEASIPDRSNSLEPAAQQPAPSSIPHRMSLQERLRAEFGIGVEDAASMLPPPPPPPSVPRNIPLHDTRPPPPPPPPLSARPQRGGIPNAAFHQEPTGIVFEINEMESAQAHPVTRSRQPNHRYARM